MTHARPLAPSAALRSSICAAGHRPRASGFLTWLGKFGALALLGAAGLFAAGSASATKATAEDDDPPARVGRIVEMHGQVSRFDHEDGRWSDAERNRPLTTGDRLSTAGGGRVELRVGSTVLRLGGGTEVELLRLDDERIAVQLHNGALALRVRSREKAAELEVVTEEARLLPMRAGHYRIDRVDDTTFAGSWRGDLRVEGPGRLTAGTGQRLELFREARGGELRHVWRGLPNDDFAGWAIADDQRDERTASSRHVSPEMTGAEDLDRWGAWDRHPEHGAIWYPHEVSADWAPYRHGRWVWVRPWGWTWVDEARWGFAPFHYGRWVHWRNRWCWAPGGYVHRPVYAPALVAWVGGPNVTVSVNIGGPAVGWVPLAPREVYVPYYRATPVYIERVNVNPRFHNNPSRPVVPAAPVAYTNQGVPGAVTVVPRDVLVRREPVARAVVHAPEIHRAQMTAVAPAGPQAVHSLPAAAPGATGAPGTVGAVAPVGQGRQEPARQEPVRPPAAVPARPEGSAVAPAAPGVVATPGRRVEPPAGDSGNARERRNPREGRELRERREMNGSEVRTVPTVPAPAQAPVQAPVQARPQQQAPAASPQPPAPPPPRQAAPVVQAPPAVVAPPVQRVQPVPPPQRGGADDERKRNPPRQGGEREREANR